jgi:hypothetical protein
MGKQAGWACEGQRRRGGHMLVETGRVLSRDRESWKHIYNDL